MKVTLELWQVISLSLTLGIALMGAFAGLVKLLLRQVELRIEKSLETVTGEGNVWRQNIEKSLETIAAENNGWRQVDRDLMQLRAELPEKYVRREDYVRGQTVIEAKLDAINSKVELVQIQGARNG